MTTVINLLGIKKSVISLLIISAIATLGSIKIKRKVNEF